MANDQDKNCGTCGWAVPIEDHDDRVECEWIFRNKTPMAVTYQQGYMMKSEGVSCPCWKPKE